jgi:hypothetical protein
MHYWHVERLLSPSLQEEPPDGLRRCATRRLALWEGFCNVADRRHIVTL